MKEILKESLKEILVLVVVVLVAYFLNYILLSLGLDTTMPMFFLAGEVFVEIKYFFREKKKIKINGMIKEKEEIGVTIACDITEETVKALKKGKEIEIIVKE